MEVAAVVETRPQHLENESLTKSAPRNRGASSQRKVSKRGMEAYLVWTQLKPSRPVRASQNGSAQMSVVTACLSAVSSPQPMVVAVLSTK